MTSVHDQTITALRAWAAGSYPLEAAVELLARACDGRFTQPCQPWIGTGAGTPPRAWLQAEILADAAVGSLHSGSERRLLAVAASLAGGTPVDLNEIAPGLGRDLLDLVLAAIAHAGGSHEHALLRPHPALGGALVPTRELAGSLHPWPVP
jgi:hypothetical protein